ncbi:MAG: hypothetical protein PGN27_21540 [Mycolicibacterium neoaurum]
MLLPPFLGVGIPWWVVRMAVYITHADTDTFPMTTCVVQVPY